MASGLAITFSGRIASGKTYVTQVLADVLAWPRASFSDYLRKVLAARGISDPDRKMLQDLGQSLVQSDPDTFCHNVIGQVAFVPKRVSFLLRSSPRRYPAIDRNRRSDPRRPV